jgi:hypothetical protein
VVNEPRGSHVLVGALLVLQIAMLRPGAFSSTMSALYMCGHGRMAQINPGHQHFRDATDLLISDIRQEKPTLAATFPQNPDIIVC